LRDTDGKALLNYLHPKQALSAWSSVLRLRLSYASSLNKHRLKLRTLRRSYSRIRKIVRLVRYSLRLLLLSLLRSWILAHRLKYKSGSYFNLCYKSIQKKGHHQIDLAGLKICPLTIGSLFLF